MEIKSDNRRRRIKLWVSDEERALVEEKAKSYGYQNLATYIRDAAIYERVTHIDFEHRKEVYDAYSKNTKILNETMKELRHFSKYATQFTKDDLKEIYYLMFAIYKNQKAMLKLIDKKLDLDVWQEVKNANGKAS